MAIPGGRLIRLGRRGAGEGDLPAPAELIAAHPAAILVIDGDGIVRDCNAAAEVLLNLARATLLLQPIEAMTGHPLTTIAADQPFAAYDIDMLLPADRLHRGDMLVAPLPDRPGWRIVSIHGGASHDLAARRNERAGRALPAAAAALLAHEVKNPLSGIRGAAQLLESGATPAQADLTRLIRDEVDRIARLIDRMEGLSDTRVRAREPLNIHAVLGNVRDVARAGFARDRTIRELYDPSLPDVLGNRDTLVQVLLNLMKNAVEATAPGGVITLTTAYRHGLSVAPIGGGGARLALPIELCVIDDGPGAPPGIAPHLFDPFVTGRPSGTGLGLALVEKLVTETGGIVEYAREGRPERTVFRLLLPRAATVRPAPQP